MARDRSVSGGRLFGAVLLMMSVGAAVCSAQTRYYFGCPTTPQPVVVPAPVGNSVVRPTPDLPPSGGSSALLNIAVPLPGFVPCAGNITLTGTFTFNKAASAPAQINFAPYPASTATMSLTTFSLVSYNASTGAGVLTFNAPSWAQVQSTYTGITLGYFGANQAESQVVSADGSMAAGAMTGGLFHYADFPIMVVAGSGNVAAINASGVVRSGATAGGGIGAALDSTGNTWTIHSDGASLDVFNGIGQFTSNIFANFGLTGATALAVDGQSNVWVGNGNGTIQEATFATASYATVTGSTTSAPGGVAIDMSGDIWVTNPSNNTLDEVIGGAAPAAALSTAVTNVATGVRP